MPFWKGKKVDQVVEVEKYCPQCLQPGLKQISITNSVLVGMRQYYCTACGYNGMVYLDTKPTSAGEDLLELELLELEDPDYRSKQKSPQELAKITLAEKWKPDQAHNETSLRSWCPFCADAKVICAICSCPPEICASHASQGLIGQLNLRYPEETLLKDVDPVIYRQIVDAFQKLASQ
jgi:hypothetical protein